MEMLLAAQNAFRTTLSSKSKAWDLLSAGCTLRWSKTNGYPQGVSMDGATPVPPFTVSLLGAPHCIDSRCQRSISKLSWRMRDGQHQPGIIPNTLRQHRFQASASSRGGVPFERVAKGEVLFAPWARELRPVLLQEL